MTAPLAHKKFQTQGDASARDQFVPDEELGSPRLFANLARK
jgi:hypothetical protein